MRRTDEASRIIPADPARIWDAMVDPSSVVVWLPPDGMTGSLTQWDARPGGPYRMVLTYDEPGSGKSTADSDVVSGRFVELVPGERFVQDAVFDSDDPAFAGTMRMTWLLQPAAAGTEVVVRAENVPPGIPAEDHAAGLASSLAQLAAFVSRPEHG